MNNNYQKLTKEIFLKRLSDDGYNSAGGARRGVSKSSMTEAEMTVCRAAIDKKFGSDAPKAAKTKAPKAAKAKPVKAAKAAGAPRGRKPKAVASAPKRRGRPSKKQAAEEVHPAIGMRPAPTKDQQTVAMASNIVGVAHGAIMATRDAKALYPDLDTSGVQTAVDVIAKATKTLDTLVAPVLSPRALNGEAKPAAAELPPVAQEQDSSTLTS